MDPAQVGRRGTHVAGHGVGVRAPGEVTVDFTQVTFNGHNICWVPDRRWRVEPRLCFSKLTFPDGPATRETGEWIMRDWDLADREARRRVYGYLLRAGPPLWIYRWVDGALLVDLWPELDLPDLLKKAWQPLIDHARNGLIEDPIRISYEHIKKLDREERKDRVEALRAAAARHLAERDLGNRSTAR